MTPPMAAIAAYLREHGVSTFVRWNLIFVVPPLIIEEQELDEGLSVIDQALAISDRAMA